MEISVPLNHWCLLSCEYPARFFFIQRWQFPDHIADVLSLESGWRQNPTLRLVTHRIRDRDAESKDSGSIVQKNPSGNDVTFGTSDHRRARDTKLELDGRCAEKRSKRERRRHGRGEVGKTWEDSERVRNVRVGEVPASPTPLQLFIPAQIALPTPTTKSTWATFTAPSPLHPRSKSSSIQRQEPLAARTYTLFSHTRRGGLRRCAPRTLKLWLVRGFTKLSLRRTVFNVEDGQRRRERTVSS